jgi:hypothetical protein
MTFRTACHYNPDLRICHILSDATDSKETRRIPAPAIFSRRRLVLCPWSQEAQRGQAAQERLDTALLAVEKPQDNAMKSFNMGQNGRSMRDPEAPSVRILDAECPEELCPDQYDDHVEDKTSPDSVGDGLDVIQVCCYYRMLCAVMKSKGVFKQ